MAPGRNEISYAGITYRNVCYRVIVWSSYGRHAAFIGRNRRADLGKGRGPEHRTRRYDASGCIFWLGFLFGGLGGIAVAALMVLFCVLLGLNQIVIGIALTLGADGLTALLHHFQFSRTYPRLSAVDPLVIPVVSEIPFLGKVLFQRHPIVYLSVLLVFVLVWVFRKTYIGLNLQAAGDVPAALDVSGVSVRSTRTWAVLTTGAFAGAGGAFLANVGAGLFVPFMTGGAGFIGIVLAMLARGHPTWVLYGAGLFGISLSLTTALQVAGFNIPTDVVQMLPFGMVILMLIMLGRNSYLPAALALPYIRGGR